MSEKKGYQFEPDYAIHPGEILEETLVARGMKKAELARRAGLSAKTVSQITNLKEPVTAETAIKLERILHVSASVWNNLDANYRLHEAKKSTREQMEKQADWASSFPVSEMVRRGLIEKPENDVDRVEKLLSFFAIGSIEAWNERWQATSASFRKSQSFQSAKGSVAVWLRAGEIEAAKTETRPYDRSRFLAGLTTIRSLTSETPETFEPRMKELCCRAGVALVFLSEFEGTHLSGAARWLDKDKALIMLSLRHKSDDHFWFSFFHEAAHILNHLKRSVFLDEFEADIEDESDEREADRFAEDFLIPPKRYREFKQKGKFYQSDILSFAESIEVSPGVIVGRLQHDGLIEFSWSNKLKRIFELIE